MLIQLLNINLLYVDIESFNTTNGIMIPLKPERLTLAVDPLFHYPN